ncbi:porin family protein [Mucilaginibacter psychrotolerans]|uniref:Aromatic hydrocarbon degradation protein n=1 Tax=Mucilaginibacter psychrotolerans TaxID=1524096 RepID=A0A4Y8SH61_9SPHI|nr:hypothetical protein [Mucilaginibacter psychrotolerans]TFF38423.1 hypothetical protein E2R66_08105 [Mucilaginibacter psychrotolerans]
MIKYIRLFIIVSLTATALGANAQSTATTSSPYSRYGLGDLSSSVMPQNIGMGGIGTAINKINSYNYINFLNPAAYSSMNYVVIDAGISSNFNTLSKSGQSNQTNSSFRLSHIAFGIPVSKQSAISFGMRPYTELGYNYRQQQSNFGTGLPADTNTVNYLYQGDGGLTKAYIGYGVRLFKHLSIGANASYIFGNLKETRSTEVPDLYGTLNSRIEESNSINGFNYDYGAQYSFDFSEKKHLVFGYSASANSKLNTQNSYIVSSYFTESGSEGVATDSLINRKDAKAKINLPQINHFGISYQHDGKYIIGADYSIGNWSSLTVAGINKGLQNSKTLNVGGQVTPNMYSLSNYFSRVDYRFGLIYDQTYLNVNNTNIKKYAATFGMGLPLPRNNTAFYKINLAAEYGKRGTLTNGLVKENYINLHLSFTLNDQWFVKYRFD